jgi:tetratricopeptide (TPR) repeat protein
VVERDHDAKYVQCVEERSATYTGSTRVQNIGLGVDHYGLNKFGSRTAEYNLVLLKLLDLLPRSSLQSWDSVPFHTVSSYTVRNELSSTIDKKLRVTFKDSSVPHALVIYGLGGAGKTQVTLRFVEDHYDEYCPILWVDAKSPETVRSSFERCADTLQLNVGKISQRGPALKDSPAITSVLRWLGARDKSDPQWLVIIDNADDVSYNVEDIIPRGPRGNIIVTSQHPQSSQLLKGQIERLQVGVMEEEEAITLLLKYLGTDAGFVAPEVHEAASKIVKRLGWLALAVDLAGAYIGEQPDRHAALQQYPADYDRHKDDLLQQESFCKLSAYEKSLWTVWNTTLDAIEARYRDMRIPEEKIPKVRNLLTFLAHFDRGNIQDELFRLASLGYPVVKWLGSGAEIPNWLMKFLDRNDGEWDSFYYRDALKSLIQYSLLQRVDGDWPGVTMHGLVQWRAKKHQSDQPWDKWYMIFLTAASQQIKTEDKQPRFWRYLTTHLMVNEELGIDQWQIGDNNGEKTAYVQSVVGQVYFEEGLWKEAEELQVQAMETRKRVLGEEHPDTLTSMANLASTYWNQGRWTEAEKLDVQVMETRKRVLGEEHPSMLTSIANLASTYRNQGRWTEAEKLFVQVMETSLRMLGEEHPDTLVSMANLASTYQSQGRWTEAERLQVQAVGTRKRVLGEGHPDTLVSMNNLTLTYMSQGRWTEAERLQVQAMETRKRVLGEEHPHTLVSMANLASTYQNQGRWTEAEKLDVQVMETRKRVLGEEHPDTLVSMNNLAWTLKFQGRDDKALELMTATVQLSRRKLGENHPNTKTFTATLNAWMQK